MRRAGSRGLPLVLAAVMAAAASASAYEIKRSEEGLPLRWPAGRVAYHIDPGRGLPVPERIFAETLDAAFAAWAGVPGLPLDLARGPARPGGFGYDYGAENASVVRVEADSWEHEPDALMLTFVHYRVSDGAILDADILVNGVGFRWRARAKQSESNTSHDGSPSSDDEATAGGEANDAEPETFDLQTCFMHEAGHFLGLAHSSDHPEAVMYPTTAPTDEREDLAEDDVLGVQALYGDAETPGGDGEGAAGCSVARASVTSVVTGTSTLVLLALVAAARRWCGPGRGCRTRAHTSRRSLRRPARRPALPGRREGAGRGATWPGWWLVACVAAAVSVAAPSPARAAVVLARPVGELARTADAIVVGEVLGSQASRSGRLIVTDTLVRVERCLKGPCGNLAVVRQPGGELDGVGLHVEGAFRATKGTRVVLFLRRGRDGHLSPIGLALGVFRIEPAKNGQLVAVRGVRALFPRIMRFSSHVPSGGPAPHENTVGSAPRRIRAPARDARAVTEALLLQDLIATVEHALADEPRK